MLLLDIINLAVDENQSLTSVLRKCLILADELRNEPLKRWASQELNGYKTPDDVPEYRVVAAPAKGNFVNLAWKLNGQNIASVSLEENHRHFAEIVKLWEPISAYEHTIKQRGTLVYEWNSNMVGFYQDRLSDDFRLVNAWQEVTKGTIVGLLDVIRTRILEMALEIKSTVGETDDALRHVEPAKVESVNQTIINHIGTMVVAGGNANVRSNIQNTAIMVGDWKQLEAALKNLSVPDAELTQLSEAVKLDGPQKMGSKTMEWIKTAAPKVLIGGVKVGVEVGKAVLTDLIKRHLGLS
jgi:hypothetical protein